MDRTLTVISMRIPLRFAFVCSVVVVGCSRPTPDPAAPWPAANEPTESEISHTELAAAGSGAQLPTEEVEPEAEEPDTVAQLGERGVAEALNAIAEGRIQTLYIGNRAPMDYVDPSTGLPGGSMGCEIDDETEAYVQEYNAVVTNWWTEAAPFENGAFITFRRRGAGENLLVEVHEDETRVAHGAGIPRPVDSGFDERLSIAAWVSTAEVPGPEPDGLGTPVDSIEWRGWSSRWQFGEAPPVDARAIRLLEELAGRPH